MAKKFVSAAPHKKKPIKTITKRRHLFKKFFNYMKSDTFMYAPLIASPHSLTSLPPTFDEAIKKSDANYLKRDCYMYAPLEESNYDTAKGEKIGSQMEARRDVRSTHIEYDSCSYNPVQRVVLHGTMLHKETVMQIVHQNCRPSSV